MKISHLRAIEKQIENLKTAIDYKEYKKEHPGTKKTPSDPLFRAYKCHEANGGGYTIAHSRDKRDKDGNGHHFDDFYAVDDKGNSEYIGSNHYEVKNGKTKTHKESIPADGPGKERLDSTKKQYDSIFHGKPLKPHEIPAHIAEGARKALIP